MALYRRRAVKASRSLAEVAEIRSIPGWRVSGSWTRGTSGKYPYPNGYVSYFNEAGQTVKPFTGQTIARSDPFWHWAWGS